MDALQMKAPLFYMLEALKQATARKPDNTPLDTAGRELWQEAAVAQYKHEAKTASYLRRTYHRSYLNRSEDGEKIFLASFEDIGARDVLQASKDHNGWYTDDFQSDTLSGVVIPIGRHSKTEGHDRSDWTENTGLFLAGTQHSDWDGVTLYTDTFDNFRDAARYADWFAEREAEECREEDEKNQREQKVEDLRDDIKRIRKACLTLLRDMRPIRKGMDQFPETVCDALRNQVQRYLNDIRTYRNEIGELT